MEFPNADPATIKNFHAHIYYDPETTKDRAARLRHGVAERFANVRVGGWHDELVGPHLTAMYQLLFAPEMFAELVPPTSGSASVRSATDSPPSQHSCMT